MQEESLAIGSNKIEEMRILYSAYACDPSKGSEAGNGWNWAYLNALKGHEVWCLTTTKGEEAVNQKLKEINLTNLHIVFIKVPSWVDYIYKLGPLLYLSYLYWQYKAYKSAKFLHKKHKFDLIHHTTWGSLQMGTFLWKLKVPLIFGPCGGGQFPPSNFKKYFHEFWKTEVVRKRVSDFLLMVNPNVRNTLKKAKLILTTNHETYDMAVSNGGKNVKVFLDTSLPEEFYPPSIPKRGSNGKLKILWVGRLFARKGLPLVLEALSQVDRIIDFELTILGDGPMGKYIPSWLDQYDLKDNVNWVGRVPWEEVQKAYANHDVFMFCSLRDSSAAQFLEAMAYGLPVITINLHGAKNLVPENAGIKVEVATPEITVRELADAVKYMYQNPQSRHEYGVNGYNFAKTQTWTIKTSIVEDYYQEIAQKEKNDKKLI